ncbi:MAG: hypothetical protein LBN27_07180 [Prevotellaceae bacterium]|jgi:tetratricopeptide (TPR) repeat protein|nr:hypothetical protein [Prevotellaceae bacterium]
MSNKKNAAPDELQKVESALGKSEAFIETHLKELGIGVLILAVVVAGVVFYKYKYSAPREVKAQEQIYKGEAYFGVDSFQVALEGNGVDYIGLKSIIKEYGSTQTGNLAKAYAGISYFKLGDYKAALNYLEDFDADDEFIQYGIIGTIGDCYVETGDVRKGISYFEKAAKKADNEVVSPFFLKKAGKAYESLGEADKAVESYTLIKDKYFNSLEARDIDKYIERAKSSKK